MKRTTNQTSPKEANTFVVIVDEDVAAYIDQQGITDTNGYMLMLLREEMERRQGKMDARYSAEIITRTPDTSGYPEMQARYWQSNQG